LEINAYEFTGTVFYSMFITDYWIHDAYLWTVDAGMMQMHCQVKRIRRRYGSGRNSGDDVCTNECMSTLTWNDLTCDNSTCPAINCQHRSNLMRGLSIHRHVYLHYATTTLHQFYINGSMRIVFRIRIKWFDDRLFSSHRLSTTVAGSCDGYFSRIFLQI